MIIEEPDLGFLYREIILDHYKNPRNSGKIQGADIITEGTNPLCGDEIELSIAFRDGTIGDLKHISKGCSISRASGSMMSEAVHGKGLEEAARLTHAFKKMMLEGLPAESLPVELEETRSLEGVKKYPVRIKCALLAWNTLIQAMDEWGHKERGQNAP